jgi:hypothetical protein
MEWRVPGRLLEWPRSLGLVSSKSGFGIRLHLPCSTCRTQSSQPSQRHDEDDDDETLYRFDPHAEPEPTGRERNKE